MRDTKLIFIDGLPGLGKTTTALWLAPRLRAAQANVNLLLESQPGHPLNVGGDSLPAGDVTGDAFFRHYTVESFIQESMDRWRSFVLSASSAADASAADVITVLDSYPYQNAVRILLQLDAARERIEAYIDEVEALTASWRPALIYFAHLDAEHMVRHFSDIASQRGEAWRNYVITLMGQAPYAASHGLEGFDGVLAFLADYKQLTDALVERSRLPHVVLGEGAGDWDGRFRQMESFLELSKE
jgi:hypothetical protein